MKAYRVSICWNAVWLFLFAVGMGIFLMVTPKYGDDYWYSWDLSEWYATQGIEDINGGGNVFTGGFPAKGIYRTIRYHTDTDNMRLANMVGPVALLGPKWLGSAVSWLALLLTVWGTLWLARVDIRRSWLVALGIALFVFVLPWYQQMGSLIFQYNYLLAGLLSVGLLVGLLRRPRGPWAMAGFVMWCIVTALWHEGFTAPLLVSLVVVMVLYRNWRNRFTLIAALAMLGALFWHFSGTSDTANLTDAQWIGWDKRRFVTTLYYHRGLWIAALVLVVFLIHRGVRALATDGVAIFLIVGIFCSMGISYASVNVRAGWWADLASIILTLRLLREMRTWQPGYRGWRGVLATVVLLMSYAEMAVADANVILFAREYPEMIRRYRENPDVTQFSTLNDYPWLSLPFTQMLHDRYRYTYYLARFYRGDIPRTDNMKVVPAGLRNLDPARLEPLGGELGIYRYGPYLVAPLPDSEQALLRPAGQPDAPVPTIGFVGFNDQFWLRNINIDYGWFVAPYRSLNCIPFTGADGRRYLYLLPADQTTEYSLGVPRLLTRRPL